MGKLALKDFFKTRGDKYMFKDKTLLGAINNATAELTKTSNIATYKPERLLSNPYFMLDTNKINARQKLDNMNILETWKQNGVIDIIMPEVAVQEATAGNNPQRTKKAYEHIVSITLATTEEENKKLNEIRNILFPTGPIDQNQENDVNIVFNAYKYGRTLLTADGGSKKQPGGILGHKEELNAIGIRVMRDTEAVQLVKEKNKERDALAIQYSRERGTSLPNWVGKD
jgi:hypothetical protein